MPRYGPGKASQHLSRDPEIYPEMRCRDEPKSHFFVVVVNIFVSAVSYQRKGEGEGEGAGEGEGGREGRRDGERERERERKRETKERQRKER
jgi:hypothetical protein